MKNQNYLLGFGAAIALMAAYTIGGGQGGRAMAQQLPESDPGTSARRIKTYGAAEVRAQPEYAELRISVRTTEPSAERAQREMQQRTSSLISVLGSLGVAGGDILSEDYEIFDNVHWYCCSERAHGSTNLLVNVRNLAKLAEIVQAIGRNGETSITRTDFKSDRLRELRDQARTNAVKAAIEKARLMAGAASATLGEVIVIEEREELPANPWWGAASNAVQNSVQAAPASPTTAAADAATFGTGRLSVTARVEVTLALR